MHILLTVHQLTKWRNKVLTIYKNCIQQVDIFHAKSSDYSSNDNSKKMIQKFILNISKLGYTCEKLENNNFKLIKPEVQYHAMTNWRQHDNRYVRLNVMHTTSKCRPDVFASMIQLKCITINRVVNNRRGWYWQKPRRAAKPFHTKFEVLKWHFNCIFKDHIYYCKQWAIKSARRLWNQQCSTVRPSTIDSNTAVHSVAMCIRNQDS